MRRLLRINQQGATADEHVSHGECGRWTAGLERGAGGIAMSFTSFGHVTAVPGRATPGPDGRTCANGGLPSCKALTT